MRVSWQKVFLIVTGLILFVNEFLIYYIQSKRWPYMPANSDRSREGTRQVVLLVADPQIQGYQDEPMFPIGTLARWDIDRYLAKTFHYAFSYSEPDVVVYLGDLMDEGSKATKREYSATFERFQSIFSPAKYVKNIFISGDNDIGGEGRDLVTNRKVSRFQGYFGNITELVKFSFIDYIKLDVHIHRFEENKVNVANELSRKKLSPLSVMLNHETMLHSSKHFVFPYTKRFRPKLIFSAHWHKAAVFTCDDCLKDNEYSWNVKRNDLTYMDDFLTINLMEKDSMAEIAVPTCSYRMGTSNIGYGVAVIDNEYSWNVKRNDLTYMDDFLTINLIEKDSMADIAVPTCSYRMGTSNIGYEVVVIASVSLIFDSIMTYLHDNNDYY